MDWKRQHSVSNEKIIWIYLILRSSLFSSFSTILPQSHEVIFANNESTNQKSATQTYNY